MMMVASKAKAETAGEVERVYQVLREWLVTAQLPPGEFLSEAVLAQQCIETCAAAQRPEEPVEGGQRRLRILRLRQLFEQHR